MTGMYKVYDPMRTGSPPSVVDWSDDGHVLPRYAYSFGFVSAATSPAPLGDRHRERDRGSALLVITGSAAFWDGIYSTQATSAATSASTGARSASCRDRRLRQRRTATPDSVGDIAKSTSPATCRRCSSRPEPRS